jgi:DNA-binding MarR family transcriptional regulator
MAVVLEMGEPNADARRTDRRLVYRLNVAQRRLQLWSEDRQAGLTAAQAGVLFSISPDGGALIGDVAKTLGVGPSGISGLVDRMQAGGLLRRAAEPEDGRAVRLVLTPKGLAARDIAKTRAAAANALLTEGFTADELDTVARWLSQVERRFKKEDGND